VYDLPWADEVKADDGSNFGGVNLALLNGSARPVPVRPRVEEGINGVEAYIEGLWDNGAFLFAQAARLVELQTSFFMGN